jgi:hypothetical protein
MLADGFDVTRGVTQLGCVTDFARAGATVSSAAVSRCPKAEEMMRRTVYLPVGPEMSAAELRRLVTSLQTHLQPRRSHRQARPSVLVSMACVAFCLFAWFSASVCRRFLPTLPALLVTLTLALAAPYLWGMALRLLAPDIFASTSPVLRYFRGLSAKDIAQRREELEACVTAPGDADGRAPDPIGAVFLTGVTGFLGKMVCLDLLQRAEELGLQRVFVLCRAKGARSAEERLRGLRILDIFSSPPAVAQRFLDLVTAVEGDVTLPGCGLSAEDRRRLQEAQVTHVLHCAATVEFNLPLAEAARTNIGGTLAVQVSG